LKDGAEPPPFPGSLCHSCAAPPRFVTSDRGSVFLYCPLLGRYPAQPVTSCDAYRKVREDKVPQAEG
jgi:hypothetical protein